MKRPPPRQLALFALLGLSLAATAWVAHEDEPQTATPARQRPPPGHPTGSTHAAWPGPAASARAAWPETDPQARAAWGDTATPPAAAPPAEPTAAVEPPAAPSAPPFPYQLVGRLTDSRPRAILNGAQRSAVVGVGEVVDGQWRVDAIEAGGLRLTYLPLGAPQFIPFAAG
jgi:hypothetical protein